MFSKYLDKIATQLEAIDRVDLAEKIDILSNTLDKIAYQVERDPAYINISRAIDSLKRDNTVAADSFLDRIKGNMKSKKEGYGDLPLMEEIYKKYTSAREVLKNEPQAAIGILQDLLDDLKKVESHIKQKISNPRGF